ncbi:hypothetical protein [Stygiolobus caldivivus]|uniref:Uncharacterized protein n=1 Tax=Stygiolobus caldivivus TaxID=2824673 RepID=A0A8D5ZFJ9_9CREN|nr:hypothetical protein [Stygiolobus caldivivus]BCU70303.1 hypothetical protein KN1_16000 [Stygiolobus caldivivus]
MKVERIEKLYFELVYSIEDANDTKELLNKVSRSLYLLLKLVYLRHGELSRTVGREIMKFLYAEESEEEKVEKLGKIVSLLREEAITTKYPYIDFYMQNFVSEMDRLMIKKGFNFFLTSNGESKTS